MWGLFATGFEGPGHLKLGYDLAILITPGRGAYVGAALAGSHALLYDLQHRTAILTGKNGQPGGFLDKLALQISDEHGDGRLRIVRVHHGYHAAAHLCRHGEYRKVGGAEGVLVHPAVGHGDSAALRGKLHDLQPRDETHRQAFQEEEVKHELILYQCAVFLRLLCIVGAE